MLRFIKIFFTGLLVSGFLYPVSFIGLPILFSSKNILAAIGLVLYIIDNINKGVIFRRDFWGAIFIASVFSLISLFSVYYNYENDYSYATYIQSFFIWYFSAYTVIKSINITNGTCSIKLVCEYYAYVSAIQCILAILIDKLPSLKIIVNSIFFQGQDFLEDIDRLYGIGASLDSAGVRFAIGIILIAFVLLKDLSVKINTKSLVGLIICFIIIGSIGNMISRTTTTGVIIALVSILIGSGVFQLRINSKFTQVARIFFPIIILSIIIFIFLYNTDPFFYKQSRFAFEGFFNWIENGKWETGSTNKLNTEMWVWPHTLEGWIFGYGKFGLFTFATDIGYCRLILYCGLLGFTTFAILFIYSSIIFAQRYRRYQYMFLLFMAMSFIIWIKVATDIFFVYALFYIFIDKKESLSLSNKI